ncbi:MAG: N-acetyltransferase [Defluviitaleaceae bacterium]|nr:N-acetyltransferase [Defluviitaleaceae bacterium]
MLTFRQETAADHYAVEELTREAFWNTDRDMANRICDEHLLVHRLRKSPSFVPELSLVALLDGQIVGHIIYSISQVIEDDGKRHDMLIFGPLSVLPSLQNRGVGKALLLHSFKVARRLRFPAVIIFGYPDYYTRVGFRRAAEFGITDAKGNVFDAFMAYPLYDGALDGICGRFHYDPVYDELSQEDSLEFDKKFPPKPESIPVSIDVLLNRLGTKAKSAIEGLGHHSLAMISRSSEAELRALDGIDENAIDIIYNVMNEHGLKWGAR